GSTRRCGRTWRGIRASAHSALAAFARVLASKREGATRPGPADRNCDSSATVAVRGTTCRKRRLRRMEKISNCTCKHSSSAHYPSGVCAFGACKCMKFTEKKRDSKSEAKG